jgi:hypothetical protein
VQRRGPTASLHQETINNCCKGSADRGEGGTFGFSYGGEGALLSSSGSSSNGRAGGPAIATSAARERSPDERRRRRRRRLSSSSSSSSFFPCFLWMSLFYFHSIIHLSELIMWPRSPSNGKLFLPGPFNYYLWAHSLGTVAPQTATVGCFAWFGLGWGGLACLHPLMPDS